MKKIIVMLLLMLVSVSAMSIAPPSDHAFGSNQWYSVFLDGEGEAQVAAKLQVYNTGKNPLKDITLEIPATSVRILMILQEVPTKEKRCIDYETRCAAYSPQSVCTAWSTTGDCVKFEKPCMREEKKCMGYEEYEGYPHRYVPLDAPKEGLSDSTKLTILLAEPIAPQKQATVLIYYKEANVAEESLGVWDFDFETLKWAYDTNTIRVAVNVESEFILNGQDSKVEYKPNFAAFKTTAEMSVASEPMSDVSRSITYERGWVKETQGLDPWESFHVMGQYSDSNLALHKGGIFWFVLIVFGLITGAFFTIRSVVRLKFKTTTTALVVLAGFVSALVVMVSWWVFIFLIDNISYWIGYSYEDLILPLLVLVSVIWFFMWMFSPSVFVGVRTKSVIAGMLTLLSTILWIILILIGWVIVLGALDASYL